MRFTQWKLAWLVTIAVVFWTLGYLPTLNDIRVHDPGVAGEILRWISGVPAPAWVGAAVLYGLFWAWERASSDEVVSAKLKSKALNLVTEMLREWDLNEAELRTLSGLEQIRRGDDVVLPRYRDFGDRIVRIHDEFAARGIVNKDFENMKRERWTNGASHRQVLDYIFILTLDL